MMTGAPQPPQTASEPLPLLKIEGPPGSGKTRELAREACRLVGEEGFVPAQILALCITPLNKRRIRHYLKDEAKKAGLGALNITVVTFEEWFLQWMAMAPGADATQPRLLSESDARVLLQEILRQAVPVGHALYYASRQPSAARVFFELIRQLQLKGLTPEQIQALPLANPSQDGRLGLVANIYRRFLERTQAANLLCHADLTHRVQALAAASPELREAMAGAYKVIMVDEAQELSTGHHHILAALPCRLMLAGNERLSIRSFRGAEPEAFKELSAYGSRLVTFLPKQACMRGNEAILSLLNRFLPSPIWEEQEPNRSQLQALVKFGFYADAEREAEGLAQLIANYVNTATVDDRPARWDDCVVLLRSAHYRSHVFHALQQQGIPFRCDVLSEDTIRLQHYWFDLLSVMRGWQDLAVSDAMLLDSAGLATHLECLPLSLLERARLIQENNRHLMRWLEASVSDPSALAELRHFQTVDQADDLQAACLMLQLSDEVSTSPWVREHYRQLVGVYRLYQETGGLLCLLDAVSGSPAFQADGALAVETGLEEGASDVPFDADLSVFRENLERLESHYQSAFHQPLPLKDVLSAFHSLWDGAETGEIQESSRGAVRLLSIHQVQGEEYPLVAIPFLVSEEFPHSREIPEVLSAAEQALLGADLAYRIDEAEEARLLAVGMTRATHKLALTTHRLEGGSPVLQSAFYRKLLEQKRALLQQERLARICRCETEPVLDGDACEIDFCTVKPEWMTGALGVLPPMDADEAPLDELYTRYTGDSKWARLQKSAAAPLFEPDKVLDLSASSIKTYMKCPRQFYYRHLLRLPQPGNNAASLGTLIHRVMEVFNQGAGQMPYSPERLRLLAESLFLFKDEPDTFFKAGFTEKDQLEMRKLSPLTVTAMKQRLLESIDDLEAKGYFDRYGTLKRIEPEKRLDGVTIDGIDGCRFSGSMDAVIQLSDGSWEIVDYKTFRSAYKAKLDVCDRQFAGTLDPLPEGDDIGHAGRFEDKLRADYPKDYQLPLYYLAGLQNPVYQGRLSAVAMQIIRPPFVDKPEQGSIRLELSGAEIEAKKAQMIDDIQRYVVAPIRESTYFAASPGRSSCGSCGYFGICEAADDSELEAGMEEGGQA